ncbi:MAG: tRNA (adenosine(37)-N6)-threonylcarbamoyltransferase complex ATPase subunit type 1 TsaE [Eudoraea sp.]|uniref:tRNA (adenosine(37)-N6)-threonylcarbamoyltransferase complex ATPase subunit type 1 TsaE n=1 Tax=Eudoraea sp. TaxID=1979955 RepID=UPI003C78D0DE
MQKIIYTIQELDEISKEILDNATSKTLCFYGEMGSGKTTLIKAMVRSLGGGDQAKSPTFGIVNEYLLRDGDLLGYHFDFYRLESKQEAMDLGLEDYFNQDAWIFMEWPEKITGLLPSNCVNISIEVIDPVTRKIEIVSTK